MPQVAVSAEFLSAFAQVPRKVQKKVREFVRKFLEDPTQTSINYERIHDIQDPKVRTVRVGIDYRAIVIHPVKGDVYTLVWVAHHDDAMDWARRKRFEVNPALGSFQVYEFDELSVAAEPAPPDDDTPLPDEALLAGRSRAELRRAGVPEPLLPSVCAVRDEAELDRLLPLLPAEIADVLFMLAAGYSVDEALPELGDRAATVDVDDIGAAIARPGSRRQFRVVADDAQFERLLDAPMEATMTYVDSGGTQTSFDDEDDGTWPIEIEVNGEVLDRKLASGESAVFGRHDSCSIVLADPHVSRQQFRVTNLGSRVKVEGLRSKNRTRVVGRRAQDDVFYSSPEVWVRVAGTHVKLRRGA